MTDVYIAYAREDRERVRPLAESLQFEGWDVWWDPSEPTIDGSAAVDQKLGSAGAIVVVWSSYSRASEYVRSEAATGLYKNKLIQTRIDAATPPRPFDQLDVVDIGLWSGERDDPNWRKTLSAIRLFAGPPGTTRPLPEIKKTKKKKTYSGPSYLEPSRSIAPGPIVVIGLMAASVAAFWFLDPMHLRTPAPADAGETAAAIYKTAGGPAEMADAGLAAAAPGVFEDSPEADADWARVDREEAEGLRDHIAAWPKSSGAETARSLLRVMDAQAWVEAVTADNESGYSRYLSEFPAADGAPGAMTAAAKERLVSLSVERTQAIEEIQRGLTAMKLYQGAIDGEAGAGTVGAVRAFASSRNRNSPALTTAAPRDLRSFSDAIARAVAAAGGAPASEPIIATATTAPATRSATTTTAVNAAAAEADRQRIAQAQAAAEQAEQAERVGAETLALAELQRTADAAAWNEADRMGTLVSYQSYLASYPAGTQATAARAALTRLNRPVAYSLDQVSSSVRVAIEAARRAETMANTRAAAARQAADAAATALGVRSIVAADGDRYESQISNGAPNGLGLRISGEASSGGDSYRGELRNGQSSGLGVHDYADNPNNAQAGALRYEGEHSGDAATGFGVTYWKNGDNFAGQEVGAPGTARGVLTFANGQRYEGEVRNGRRHGVGVVWSADGQVLMAGRWENGELIEPAISEPIPLVPSGPAATPAP